MSVLAWLDEQLRSLNFVDVTNYAVTAALNLPYSHTQETLRGAV